MRIPRDAVRLRIYLGETAKHEGQPLYEAIVLAARRHHLAGATVLRGPLGFGHSSRLHTTKVLRLSEDLPLVIDIIDGPERIEAFLPVLEPMIGDRGLVTIEKIQVLRYGPNRECSGTSQSISE